MSKRKNRTLMGSEVHVLFSDVRRADLLRKRRSQKQSCAWEWFVPLSVAARPTAY